MNYKKLLASGAVSIALGAAVASAAFAQSVMTTSPTPTSAVNDTFNDDNNDVLDRTESDAPASVPRTGFGTL